jgi:hypothetical protein
LTVSDDPTIVPNAQPAFFCEEMQTMMLFMKKMDRAGARLGHLSLLLVIWLGSVLPVCAQEGDPRIVQIRRLDRQVNEQIAESERVDEGTGVYCNELVINKGDKPWPAVGIYKTVFSFITLTAIGRKTPTRTDCLRLR